jgi:hypothetical protein
MTDEGLAQEFLGARITRRPGELILDQEHYCRSIVRDFGKYIGSRNYTIVPMQKDTAQNQPESLSPDQQAWVERFPYATILGKIVNLNAITRPDISPRGLAVTTSTDSGYLLHGGRIHRPVLCHSGHYLVSCSTNWSRNYGPGPSHYYLYQ